MDSEDDKWLCEAVDECLDNNDNAWLIEALDSFEANSRVQRGGVIHDPLAGKVVIKPNGSRMSSKYGIVFDRYDVNVKDLDYVQLPEVPYFIHRLLGKLIDDVSKKALPHYKVRMCLDHSGLAYPIWTPPIDKSQLTASRWMAEVC